MKQHHIIRFIFLSCISLLLGVYYTKIFSVSLATSNSVGFSLVIVSSTGNIFTGDHNTGSVNTGNINTGNINSSSSSSSVKDKIQIDTGSVFTGGHGSATGIINNGINNNVDTGVTSGIQVIKIKKKTIKPIIKKPDLLEPLGLCMVSNENLPKITSKPCMVFYDICKLESSKFMKYLNYREFNITNNIVYNHLFGYIDISANKYMGCNNYTSEKKYNEKIRLLKINRTSIIVSLDFWRFLDKLISFFMNLF